MEVLIRFADGSEVKAEQNGNCYITEEKPEIPADLSNVTVKGEGIDLKIANAQLVEPFSIDGRYWFSFVEIPEEELARERTDAQVMYTALMTDTLIEEG